MIKRCLIPVWVVSILLFIACGSPSRQTNQPEQATAIAQAVVATLQAQQPVQATAIAQAVISTLQAQQQIPAGETTTLPQQSTATTGTNTVVLSPTISNTPIPMGQPGIIGGVSFVVHSTQIVTLTEFATGREKQYLLVDFSTLDQNEINPILNYAILNANNEMLNRESIRELIPEPADFLSAPLPDGCPDWSENPLLYFNFFLTDWNIQGWNINVPVRFWLGFKLTSGLDQPDLRFQISDVRANREIIFDLSGAAQNDPMLWDVESISQQALSPQFNITNPVITIGADCIYSVSFSLENLTADSIYGSSLEVYLVDVGGRIYTTMPSRILTDPKGKQEYTFNYFPHLGVFEKPAYLLVSYKKSSPVGAIQRLWTQVQIP